MLSFENSGDRKYNTGCYLLKVEIKYYNVMTDGRNVFDPIKSHMKTYDNRKVVLGQGDDFTTVYLLISKK